MQPQSSKSAFPTGTAFPTEHEPNGLLIVFPKGGGGFTGQMSLGNAGLNQVQQAAFQHNSPELLTALGNLQEALGPDSVRTTL